MQELGPPCSRDLEFLHVYRGQSPVEGVIVLEQEGRFQKIQNAHSCRNKAIDSVEMYICGTKHPQLEVSSPISTKWSEKIISLPISCFHYRIHGRKRG